MTDTPFSCTYANGWINRILEIGEWSELLCTDGSYYQVLSNAETGVDAGYVRLWRAPAESSLNRMIHMRLIAGPVETHLLFVFGEPTSSLPHLHAQVVQFPPDGCVYNIDLLPRLDPVDHPEWFTRVMNPLRRAYRKATGDSNNSCAQAPANPALAVYMSPWGIASGRADFDELQRVTPSIDEYLEHYCRLAGEDNWDVADQQAMRDRDQRHLELFFADELDPRAWNGVYRIIGEKSGHAVKRAFMTPLDIS
jgi:hypothetical protein